MPLFHFTSIDNAWPPLPSHVWGGGEKRRKHWDCLTRARRKILMSMSSFTIPEKDLIIEVQDELVIDSMIKEGKIEFDEVTFGGRLNATQADRMVGTPGIKDRRLFEQSLSAVSLATFIISINTKCTKL